MPSWIQRKIQNTTGCADEVGAQQNEGLRISKENEAKEHKQSIGTRRMKPRLMEPRMALNA